VNRIGTNPALDMIVVADTSPINYLILIGQIFQIACGLLKVLLLTHILHNLLRVVVVDFSVVVKGFVVGYSQQLFALVA
jgi:hypothetical protein